MLWPAAPVPRDQILTLLPICASSRRPSASSIVEVEMSAGGSPGPADPSHGAKLLRTKFGMQRSNFCRLDLHMSFAQREATTRILGFIIYFITKSGED